MSVSIPDNILLVAREDERNRYGYNQAFVVDPSNKDQLKTARRWGSTYLNDKITQKATIVEPIEILVKNGDFTLTFLECANESSQGGKLSFWNCLIEKEPNIKFVIGIDQSSILSLIKQSKISNGKVLEKLYLYKNGSTAWVCHEGMTEWQESVKTELKPRPKTTKYVLGQSYKTITRDDIYIGDIYVNHTITHEIVDSKTKSLYGPRKTDIAHIKFGTEPKKLMILSSGLTGCISKLIESGTVKSVTDLYNQILINVEKEIEANSPLYNVISSFEVFSWVTTLVTKFPSRELGNITLEAGSYEPILEKILTRLRETFTNYVKLKNLDAISVNDSLHLYGYTSSPNKKHTFTDEEKEAILEVTNHTVFIDFGDGIEHRGKRV